ncbi:PREDICTED: protein singed wings 2 [Dufourea novaeangliae]|uniref:Protein singed wings 2 n=1 Tax=Dufourea novaeangliae TaxID=178035 RepID=A0A154P0L5_DUFNO|nr:PREDICTED: protein singed wings 2 [Dufourea novaeangliae]KZC05469.1 Protein singed wings 2 [Dufourea novaeangliae]
MHVGIIYGHVRTFEIYAVNGNRDVLPNRAVVLLPSLQVSSASEENCYLGHGRLNATIDKCDFIENDHLLVCFHSLDDKWKSGGEAVRTLVLCHWSLETFNPEITLHGFSSLRKLAIVNSSLTMLASTFPSETRLIENIKMTGTKLRELPEHVFSNLSSLKTLDLRNNSIQEVNVKTLDLPSLRDVYLSGNPLKCTERTKWILDQTKGSPSRKIADKENLRCSAPYEGRPLVQVVEIIKTLKEECKRTVCVCELVYVVGQGGKHIQRQLMAFVSVNCSDRGLTEMPGFLPANTTTLRLTENKIHDLTPLTTNPAYRGVIDLYLDNNQIETIVQLEGSSWVDRFRLLSLRGNRLTDLPTYALENALQHNGNAVSLYLGNNPWRCDCLFTPSFQELLIRYTSLVKDVNDIRCLPIYGNDNSDKIIRDLTRTEICTSPDEDPLVHPLDVLNIILALLIFLIIGKLLYDYWSFKKTGKLPWIVAKIP